VDFYPPEDGVIAKTHVPESKKFFGLRAASLFFKKEPLPLPYLH
jgi:hypothetical protein